MALPEKHGLTIALISPGGKVDNPVVAMLAEATGSLVTRITRPDQLCSIGKPAIIASNGLSAPCKIIDNSGIERVEYPTSEAKRVAELNGMTYVELSPSRWETFFSVIGENAAYFLGRDNYTMPTYCSPRIARQRINRAVKAAKAALQSTT